jgi:hypothetical protein
LLSDKLLVVLPRCTQQPCSAVRLTSGGPLRDNDELLLVNEGVMACEDVWVVELLQQVNLFDATFALFGHHGINVNTAA